MSARISLTLSLLMVALLIATANAKLEKTVRIVNGENRTIEQLPFMVQIRDPRVGTFCGGTLISPQHVLTAAHCFEPPSDFKSVIVVAGTAKRSAPGVQRKVVSVTLHPEYENIYVDKGTNFEKKVGSKADVAVIKLDKPFGETNQIKVLNNLCSEQVTANDFIEVSGWGHTSPIDPLSDKEIEWSYSEHLKSVRLPVISKEDCIKKLSGDGLIVSNTNICAFKAAHDSCVSDSGGPGISKGKLCAVVSYGIGCAYGTYPGVYTSIPTVRKFIDEQLKA